MGNMKSSCSPLVLFLSDVSISQCKLGVCKFLYGPVHVPYSWKFSPGEKNLPISLSTLVVWQKSPSTNFLSCVNNYIDHTVIFTSLTRISSAKCFSSTKEAGLDEIFLLQFFWLYSTLRQLCSSCKKLITEI